MGCDRDIIPRTQTRHSSNLTQIVITSPQPRPERHQQKSINNDCVVGKVLILNETKRFGFYITTRIVVS